MKVSLSWLKELVDIKQIPQQLANQLSLSSIGVKEFTDETLDLDLTYNRGDLLSLRGVAREIAAVTGSKLLFSAPNAKDYPWEDNKLAEANVKLDDTKLSSVQCVAKIEGLKFGNSSKEWAEKLSDSGMRAVNNIVDVTNLVVLEYGQPLHAFDKDSVKDETIIVRAAKDGEEIATLDNKLRKLTTQDIVLADTEGPVDVAGIMGGKDTEVKDSTTTILLSASMFNPVMVRKTSKRLGLVSEASKRFQHGLTKTNLLQAFAAAIKMYEDLGGKLTAISLVGDLEDHPQGIVVSQTKINNLLGVNIEPEFVQSSLEKLNFKVEKKAENWLITPPFFRLDISIEEDVIEEIARMYGYEKIDGKPLADEGSIEIDQTFYNYLYDLKVKLKEAGLTEVQTYSFYSTKVIQALGWSNERGEHLVKIANPISSETKVLRQSIWPNLLEVIGKNLRKGYKDIAIFEIGKTFNIGPDGKPLEDYRLAIALNNGTDNPLAELYQIITSGLHLKGVELSKARAIALKQTTPPAVVKDLFHPKRFLAVEKNGKQIGKLAEVHLRVLNALGIEKRVAVLEIDLRAPR